MSVIAAIVLQFLGLIPATYHVLVSPTAAPKGMYCSDGHQVWPTRADGTCYESDAPMNHEATK